MSISSLVRVCGSCDQPVNAHLSDNNVVLDMGGGFTIECYREWNTIGYAVWFNPYGVEFNDYFVIDGVTVLANDVMGSEARSGSDLMTQRIAEDYDLFGLGADEAQYVSPFSPNSEQAKVDRWSDRTYRTTPTGDKSWLCTSILGEAEGEYALSQASNGSRSKSLYDTSTELRTEQRNAFVEGNDGFVSVELLNEALTEKYHNKLLNVFVDKDQQVRIGSIRLIKNVDGSLTARCVNQNCGPNGLRASITIWPEVANRADMEHFVTAIIGHGNNHAASWFRNRPEFYKVHRPGCRIDNCDPKAGACTDIPEDYVAPQLLTPEEKLAFLKEHATHCHDAKCAHEYYLWSLTSIDADLNTHATSSAA